MGETEPLGSRLAQWSGIYLGGFRIHLGSFVIVVDQRPFSRIHPIIVQERGTKGLDGPENATVFLARIDHVYNLELIGTKECPTWAQITPMRLIRDRDPTFFTQVFSPLERTWIPLCHPRKLYISSHPLVVPHPENPNEFLRLMVRNEAKMEKRK